MQALYLWRKELQFKCSANVNSFKIDLLDITELVNENARHVHNFEGLPLAFRKGAFFANPSTNASSLRLIREWGIIKPSSSRRIRYEYEVQCILYIGSKTLQWRTVNSAVHLAILISQLIIRGRAIDAYECYSVSASGG